VGDLVGGRPEHTIGPASRSVAAHDDQDVIARTGQARVLLFLGPTATAPPQGRREAAALDAR